ncbi:hypothetical protein [Mesorhizobium sp.]|uniref:hypothetical protein n=1 Tax=Mesorhizobium sp. TaxID=1871066 RepID=UPI00121B3871|nr:hypothetical protein [Mesorhizobium sp.]TIS53300.1 MAG: hypothetical protein E5W91_31680 [Mesorhizobium sp.]TIS85619.1 MAG: hypothetical protein E5W89_32485 [Mesorhizobium sp.]
MSAISKRRWSRKREETARALVMKFFPNPSGYLAVNAQMGLGMRRGGLHGFIKRWVLAHGTWPEGLHAVPWNNGQNWLKVDFTRLPFDPKYLGEAEPSPFAQGEYERKMAEIDRERPHVWGEYLVIEAQRWLQETDKVKQSAWGPFCWLEPRERIMREIEADLCRQDAKKDLPAGR